MTINYALRFRVDDVSQEIEGDTAPRDVLATVIEQPTQSVLGSLRLQIVDPALVPEVGDEIVVSATVLAPNGMPKTAGLESVERTSLT